MQLSFLFYMVIPLILDRLGYYIEVVYNEGNFLDL